MDENNKRSIGAGLLKSEKTKKLIVAAGILGIALIFISTLSGSFFDRGENAEKSELFSVEKYCEDMQNNLESTVESIEGVGEAQVLLTIENSIECVYLENGNTKTKEIEPVIRGVVVVCRGGDNPVTVQRVLSAVTKALNISTAKVCVTKLTGG